MIMFLVYLHHKSKKDFISAFNSIVVGAAAAPAGVFYSYLLATTIPPDY